jgi:hypothetical protein
MNQEKLSSNENMNHTPSSLFISTALYIHYTILYILLIINYIINYIIGIIVRVLTHYSENRGPFIKEVVLIA